MIYSLAISKCFLSTLVYKSDNNAKNKLWGDGRTIINTDFTKKLMIKDVYRHLVCIKCGKDFSSVEKGLIDLYKVFEMGYFEPFIIGKPLMIHEVDFTFTAEGQLICNNKFIETIKGNGVNGYREKPIGETGWFALKITEFCQDELYYREPACELCNQPGRAVGKKLDAKISIDAKLSFFTSPIPLNYGGGLDREIFMTDALAQLLAKSGIKGGYCKEIPLNPKNESDFSETRAIPLKGLPKQAPKNQDKKLSPKIKIRKSKLKELASEEAVFHFEKIISNSLETNYRNFLLLHNGGVPSPNRYGDDEYEIDHFYSVQELPQAWEEFQHELKEAMGGDAPEDTLLPIAPDTSGNTFCLAIAGPNTGRIALFDHEENDYNFVEDSFTAFFNSLKKASVEEE